MIYEAVNESILQEVPKHSRNILDIGCGTGALGKRIKSCQECYVTGITYSEEEAVLARKSLDCVLVQDLNTLNIEELGVFDCIICSHILEHLPKPDLLLQHLHNNLDATNGMLLVAIPNVLHWKQRLQFLRGDFQYTDGGIMDRTHLRFYDWKTSLQLLELSGYEVISRSADGYFPLSFFRKIIGPIALRLDKLAAEISPSLFGVQFIFVARQMI